MIRHYNVIDADKWASNLKGSLDLKSAVRKILNAIETTTIAEEIYPTAENAKLKIRGPIGEIIALGFFELTRLDRALGYDNSMHHTWAADQNIKGVTKDDRGVDLVTWNKKNMITPVQVKLIGNFTHSYGTVDHEKQARSSFIEESSNILTANSILLEEHAKVKNQVFFFTCQAMPDYTTNIKLRGKLRQLCFSKTSDKTGILNINDFTNTRFMNSLYELIMDSSSSIKNGVY